MPLKEYFCLFCETFFYFKQFVISVQTFSFLINGFCQGAMAVEIRSNDKRTTNLVGELSDMETLLTVAAERAFMRTLVRINFSVNLGNIFFFQICFQTCICGIF